jgi:NodT family efflux transporter outer membrane factor (OMF) lipoprotein
MALMSRNALRCLLGVAGLLLAGCTVGPDYKGPPQVLPAADTGFHRVHEIQTTPGAPGSRWWLSLSDPGLNRLEDAALGASPDIAAAVDRLRESRADLSQQHADLLPTTGADATYLHFHSGASGSSGGLGALSSGLGGGDLDLYDTSFDATWELDIFGGQRRAVESSAATVGQRVADLADAQVSLTADVAQAYVSLRDLQNRRALLQESARLQSRTLQLTELRRAGGTATDLDVERLNTQLQTTLSDIVPFEADIEAELDRLAILTGQLPGALDAALSAPAALPMPPMTVAVGDPAALLRRRPDIRAAERQIAAANATIGQHVADLFPKVTLLGDLGFGSTDPGRLFDGGSFSALGGPMLQWKPFDFGRTEAQIGQAKAARDEAAETYRSTVLKALDDAETSMARYGVQRQSVAALLRVKLSADRAALLTRKRYTGGTATLIDTLDTERQRVQAEQSLAEGEANLTQDFIGLQKSLGLGWGAD